jgi:hypothetical protein
MKKFFLAYTVALMIFCSLLVVQVYAEVDKVDFVTKVIDGDTFDISSGERIRLADVDAPEYYEYGYSEATDYLSSLISGETVYLDVDDIYIYDYNGEGDRVVCIAYLDYNSTHWINVNKALLDEGHALISNYYNEFYPFTWSLHVPKDGSSESSPTPEPEPGLFLPIEAIFGIGAGFIIVILIVIIMLRKRK